MNYIGDFDVGANVFVWYNTFDSNDPSASVTTTNLIDTDVHIYKDDSLTQRNNAAGVAVDVDVDTFVGAHKITIDTADNTVANFYEAGHDYAVVVVGTTVDAATVNAVVGTFSIANRRVAGEMCHSSIEAYTDTTNFTLTAGEASGDNDAYNGCTIIVTDQTTRIQKGVAHISDYVGATRAIVLHAAPLATNFTWAVGDSVEIFATAAFANVNTIMQQTQTANDNGADLATITGTAGALIATDAQDLSGSLDVNTKTITANAITATAINADAITAAKIADDAIAAEHLAAGAIVAATFAANAITSTVVADNTITAAKINADAITAAKIADDAIAAEHLATGAIVAATFAANAITSTVVADNTITAAKLNADCITNAKIADDAIAAENFATGAIAADAVGATALDNIVMSDLATGAPSATASLPVALNWIYESWRNKTTTTATLVTIKKDDGTTDLTKSTISDDATTFTKAEFVSG